VSGIVLVFVAFDMIRDAVIGRKSVVKRSRERQLLCLCQTCDAALECVSCFILRNLCFYVVLRSLGRVGQIFVRAAVTHGHAVALEVEKNAEG